MPGASLSALTIAFGTFKEVLLFLRIRAKGLFGSRAIEPTLESDSDRRERRDADVLSTIAFSIARNAIA